jgi:hypothetical protein
MATTAIQALEYRTKQVSKQRDALRCSLLMFGFLAAAVITVEGGARLLVEHISRVESRISSEYAAALLPPSGSRPLVVFVGNSLLLEGVRFDRLRDASAAQFEARRFVVESADYRDWQYGLRRLYAAGVRPSVLVLMLDAKQLVSDGSRGEYTAFRLTRHRDILALSSDLGLNPTATSSMVFANFSMFYGLRSEIRKAVLGRLMPDLPRLTHRFALSPAPEIPGDVLRTKVRARMRALRDESAAHNVRLVFAMHPSAHSYDTVLRLQSAVTEAGVPAMLPFGAGEYGAGDFTDGLHLTGDAADRYTGELIATTRQAAASWFRDGGHE